MVVRSVGSALLVALMSFGATTVLAEEGHELSTIKGDHGIDLKAFDHAMAGSIKDFVVWGSVNEATGTSELIMRRDGQDVKTQFAKVNNVFSGTVRHTVEGVEKITAVAFSGLDRQKNVYSFKVNNELVKASVVAEDFRGNHFIKPTYTIIRDGAEPLSFKFEGQACYGYSLHIIALMIAATTH